MRIGSDHACSSAPAARSRVASSQSDSGFTEALASAVESDKGPGGGSPPELSAATYRLFAAVELERGDTQHAAIYLAKVPYAREAGLPAVPSGVLAENGRWDYNEAAAALPETGIFDTASGQGAQSFTPYNTLETTPDADGCAPTETAAAETTPEPAAPSPAVDRLRDRSTARTLRASIEASLLDRITG